LRISKEWITKEQTTELKPEFGIHNFKRIKHINKMGDLTKNVPEIEGDGNASSGFWVTDMDDMVWGFDLQPPSW